MITAAIVLFFLLVAVASLVVWALCLRLGLRWGKVAEFNTRQIVLATVLVWVLQIGFAVTCELIAAPSELWVVMALIELAISIVIGLSIITFVFNTNLAQAVKAWLATLLQAPAAIVLALLIRLFFVEAFVISANSMAPTLLGHRLASTCPQCGAANYGSSQYEYESLMICDNFHVENVSNLPPDAHFGDRVIVAKFISQARWDLVVCQLPSDPSTNYVKRLIGLPGETVHIENGSVWINGEKLPPPEHLTGLEYVAEFPDDPYLTEIAGSRDNPAVLGEGEYFVLGDFSAQSLDSRLWEQGAEGHPPYAVPASHMIGVVTTIYWPPERWRSFR